MPAEKRNRRTVPRVCEWCGRDFLAYANLVKKGYHRFCSRTCWRDPVRRFWAKVDKNGPTVRTDLGPCWVWTASCDRAGYGQLGRPDGSMARAHRVSYEIEYAVTLAPEQKVCHRCDNPPCVRPDHLFEGTQAANLADMVAKGRHWLTANPGASPYARNIAKRQVLDTAP